MTKPILKIKLLTAMTASLISMNAFALEKLDDEALSENTGAGLAFYADNFSLKMGDTDYIKIQSTGGDVVETGKKAEIYAYGLRFGKTDTNNSFGREVLPTSLGSATNPAILRVYKSALVPVFDPTLGATAGSGEDTFDVMEIALSKRKAGDKEDLKISAWADLIGREAGTDGITYTSESVKQNNNGEQEVVHPNRTRIAFILDQFSLNGSIFQLWESPSHPTNANYSNKLALSGLVRLNTAEEGSLRISADVQGTPELATTGTNTNYKNSNFGDAVVSKAPTFGTDTALNKEGIYWKNFDLNMPLGALGYQPVILTSGGESGREMVFEVARIPNNPTAYNKAYIDYAKYNAGDATEMAKMCTPTSCELGKATHATLSFQLSTRLNNGDYTDTANPRYQGVGLGANTNPNVTKGSAGINVGSLDTLESLGSAVEDQGGTYNKFEGLFVQHLKITTNAFGK